MFYIFSFIGGSMASFVTLYSVFISKKSRLYKNAEDVDKVAEAYQRLNKPLQDKYEKEISQWKTYYEKEISDLQKSVDELIQEDKKKSKEYFELKQEFEVLKKENHALKNENSFLKGLISVNFNEDFLETVKYKKIK